MKYLLLFAGTAALSLAGPALAKPAHGNGHGHGHGQGAQGYGVGGCPPGLAKKAIPSSEEDIAGCVAALKLLLSETRA